MKKLFFPTFITLLLCLFAGQQIYAQTTTETEKQQLVQFSGLLLSDINGKLTPVPYASVYIPNRSRGTYSDGRGFFTLVVDKTDKVRFSSVGFETVTISLPDTLTQDRYSIVQLMVQDTINLPETIIFPWPSKEHFKLDYLAMDVTPELQKIAAENLANDYLAEAIKNEKIVPYSGMESSNFYLRQQAKEYYYIGQTPPMNIFSPLAWAKFIQSWKKGDFKKKKKK